MPRVLWTRPDDNVFAMQLVDPRLRNWKQDLLAGRVSRATALRAGTLLGTLHARSAGRRDIAERFANMQYFHELRIEPFFLRVAERLPALAADIGAVVVGLPVRRTALIHGDFSPKNILADEGDIVILDFEVAHWGNPRFDLAFCVSHLLLKANRPAGHGAALAGAAGVLLDAYAAAGPAVNDADLVRLTGCLMLARFEGSSPLDYAGDVDQPAARALAESMLTYPGETLSVHLVLFAELRS